MKQPWKVFLKSIEGHVRGRTVPESPVDPESDEAVALVAAFETARTCTAYFLIRDLHWVEDDAVRLADDFVKTSLDWLHDEPDIGVADLRVRLQDQYADWMVRHAWLDLTWGSSKIILA